MTTQNKEFVAKHVIVTVSTEVLKQGRIHFNPELPEAKVNALSKTNLTNCTKVFVQWQTRWWANEKYSTHVMLTDEGEDNARWPLFLEIANKDEA